MFLDLGESSWTAKGNDNLVFVVVIIDEMNKIRSTSEVPTVRIFTIINNFALWLILIVHVTQTHPFLLIKQQRIMK